jgi:hypothetical protein
VIAVRRSLKEGELMNRFRLLTVLVVALSALPLMTLAGTAHADLLYQFDVHETTMPALGFQPFSFSFTVPTFVTDGQSPAFTPFTVTFGTHSYKMINDLAVTSLGLGNFCFATGGMILNPDCSINATQISNDGEGAITLETPGGLPTATGMQTLADFSDGVFGTGPFVTVAPLFGGALDITTVTSVPEPASVALLSMGVVAVGWSLRKRRGVAL